MQEQQKGDAYKMYRLIRKGVNKVCSALATVAMVAIFVIMFVLVIDIILRFATENMAILGTYEMTEMAMVIIIFLSLAVTQIEKEHVSVVMAIERFPWRVRTFIQGVISAFTTVLCFYTLYAGVLQVQSVQQSGVTTGVLFIPHVPFTVVMTIGLGALMVVFILDTIDYFVAGIKNVKPEEELRKQQEKALLAESKI